MLTIQHSSGEVITRSVTVGSIVCRRRHSVICRFTRQALETAQFATAANPPVHKVDASGCRSC